MCFLFNPFNNFSEWFMKKLNFLLIALLSIGLTACGGGSDDGGSENPGTDNPGGENPGGEIPGGTTSTEVPSDLLAQVNNVTLKNAGISDAVGLIITDSAGQAKTLSPSLKSLKNEDTLRNFDGTFSNNTLYKVTAEGTISEVSLDDASGADIRGSLTPTSIVEMGNGWTLLSFTSVFNYVERQAFSDGSGGSISYQYYLHSADQELAYLVHNDTGNAYAADWAWGESDVGHFIDYDFGDDDVLDTNNDGTLSGTEFISSNPQTDVWGKYDRFPAASFDEQGRMYVAGNVLQEVDHSDNYWTNVIYKGRVLRIDTNNVGAETLTAEVIQTNDLESTINPTSITVSEDGQLLYYSGYTNDDYSDFQRIVNLRDNASYAVQAVENGGPAIRGKDGLLYSISHEEFTTDAYDGTHYAAVISRYSLVDGKNKPIAEQVALVNEGQVTDPSDRPYVSEVGTLADWNELKSLITNMPAFDSDTKYYSWYNTNIDLLAKQAEASTNYIAYYEIPTSSHNRHIVSGNVVTYDGYSALHIIDLPNARVQAYFPDDLGFESYTSYAFNNDSLFFFGKDNSLDRIARWTPKAAVETETIALDTDTFDVTRFKVLSQDSVMFEADVLNPFSDGTVSLTSGAKILAEATFDGQVTILDTIEAGEASVLVMERISQGDFLVVDGDVNDWSTDHRSLSDATADTTNGTSGDLAYLSSFENSDYLWVLVEANTDFDDTRTIISLNSDKHIELHNGDAYFVDDLAVADSKILLASVGGIDAKAGKIIELRLPKATVPTSTSISVATEVDKTFGQITYLSEAIDSDAETVSITLSLDSPLGSVEGDISILSDYAITFTDANWDENMADSHDDDYAISVWDGSGDGDAVESSLADAAGSYSVSGDELTVILPFTTLGIEATDIPESLDIVVESDSEVIAVPVDIMN